MKEFLIKPLIIANSTTSRANKIISRTLKSLTILLTVFALTKYIFPATMEQFVNWNSAFAIGNVIRWLLAGAFIYLIMSVFYNNEKMKKVAKLYLIPLALLSIIFMPDLFKLNYQLTLSNVANALFITNVIIELVLILVCAVLLILQEGIKKQNYLSTLKTIAFVTLFTIPLNIFEFFKKILPQNVLTALTYKNFGIWHLVAILMIVAVTLGLYFYLRKKEKEEKWQILTILGLAFILTYVSKVSISIISGYQGKTQWFNMLPLYLCDVGAILIPITMLTRKKFFLDNLFFVNAVGALSIFFYMGIDSLNGNNYIFTFNYLYFVLTHAMLFALCIMPVLLKLYKPKFKGILNGIYVFLGLYIIATIVSAYISTLQFPIPEAPGYYVYFMPNYCFTQICPLPLPFNFPSTTILGMSFNLPYIALLLVFYLAMFLTFQGLWYGIAYLIKLFKRIGKKNIPPSEEKAELL